jgi:hypothetical protein
VALSRFSFAPFPSSVVRSARFAFAPWAGGALGVSFRPSSRAFSGFVAVVRFASFAAAARFSASWGGRFARSGGLVSFCAVRSVPAAAGVAPSWCVSVPVAPPPVPVRRGGASRRLAAVFAARCGLSLSAGA